MLASIYASSSYYSVTPTFSKSPLLFIERSRSFASDSDTIETVAFEIALSIPSLMRQHALTIAVVTEISQSKREEAALAFLYLAYTLLEPNFRDFHDYFNSAGNQLRDKFHIY